MNFNNFLKRLKEEYNFKEYLNEALLMVGSEDNGSSFPKYNNIMIVTGGMGSGKSFAQNNILGFEGTFVNSDKFKEMILKYKPEKFRKRFADLGYDIDKMDLSNPDDVSALHKVFSKSGLFMKKLNAVFTSQKDKTNKPNIILETTGKDIETYEEMAAFAESGGYDKKNIHIVWILNNYETASIQNKQRSRKVSDEALYYTHIAASNVLKKLIQMSENLSSLIDGEIIVIPNMKNIDTSFKNSSRGNGGYLKLYTCYILKERGKAPKSLSEIEQEALDKINSYIPKDAERWK